MFSWALNTPLVSMDTVRHFVHVAYKTFIYSLKSFYESNKCFYKYYVAWTLFSIFKKNDIRKNNQVL